MFIVKADYKPRISTDLLNRIIAESEEDILQFASRVAEDTLRSTVGVLYDINPELEKAGQDRNFLLVDWALSITTYQVYQRIDDEEVPEKVIKNYDDAIDELKKVSLGKYPLALAPKPATISGGGGDESAELEGNGLRRIGYQKKRTHKI